MKALILYTNTGAGHASAGKAICNALDNLNIKTVEIDTLSFAGKNTSKKVENSLYRGKNKLKKSLLEGGIIYEQNTRNY